MLKYSTGDEFRTPAQFKAKAAALGIDASPAA